MKNEGQNNFRRGCATEFVKENTTSVCVPMPGQIVEVNIHEGQLILDDYYVAVILESMKMLNRVLVRRGAVITNVQVSPGQHVEKGDVMFNEHVGFVVK
jgi:biotin carboxyl carrier protein